MIVVKIEMWPLGIESNKYDIGHIVIANDGRGTHTCGHYDATIFQQGSPKVWKDVRVEEFPRQAKNVYHLLYQVLHAALGHRNKDVHVGDPKRISEGVLNRIRASLFHKKTEPQS